MAPLDAYLIRCSVLAFLPCFVLSFLVSSTIGSFSWQSVAIGTLAGMLSAVPLVCRRISSEIRIVSNAALKSTGAALAHCVNHCGYDLDQAAMAAVIEAMSRKEVEGQSFYTLSIRTELQIPTSPPRGPGA